jgi:hypothetical protein
VSSPLGRLLTVLSPMARAAHTKARAATLLDPGTRTEASNVDLSGTTAYSGRTLMSAVELTVETLEQSNRP